jgi:hypothetical protein
MGYLHSGGKTASAAEFRGTIAETLFGSKARPDAPPRTVNI